MASIVYKGKQVGETDFTELYLKADGTNNSTAIIDSSPNPKTCTAFSGAKISTAQSKYGGSSLLFTANGEYISIANDNALWFGTKDFTVEFWLYRLGEHQQFARYLTTKPGDVFPGFYIASGGAGVSNSKDISISISSNGTSFNVANYGLSDAIELNTWYHLALTRKYNVFRFFLDGIQKDTSTSYLPLFFDTSNIIVGGSGSTPARSVNVHIDSLVITIGKSKYETNFNPETETGLAY